MEGATSGGSPPGPENDGPQYNCQNAPVASDAPASASKKAAGALKKAGGAVDSPDDKKAWQAKYRALLVEHRSTEQELLLEKRKSAGLVTKLAARDAEVAGLLTIKARLESLCREMQVRTKEVTESSIASAKAAAEDRKDDAERIEASIADALARLAAFAAENDKLRSRDTMYAEHAAALDAAHAASLRAAALQVAERTAALEAERASAHKATAASALARAEGHAEAELARTKEVVELRKQQSEFQALLSRSTAALDASAKAHRKIMKDHAATEAKCKALTAETAELTSALAAATAKRATLEGLCRALAAQNKAGAGAAQGGEAGAAEPTPAPTPA